MEIKKMNTYELYQDIDETQKRLERQVETILPFLEKEVEDDASLPKTEKSAD